MYSTHKFSIRQITVLTPLYLVLSIFAMHSRRRHLLQIDIRHLLARTVFLAEQIIHSNNLLEVLFGTEAKRHMVQENLEKVSQPHLGHHNPVA